MNLCLDSRAYSNLCIFDFIQSLILVLHSTKFFQFPECMYAAPELVRSAWITLFLFSLHSTSIQLQLGISLPKPWLRLQISITKVTLSNSPTFQSHLYWQWHGMWPSPTQKSIHSHGFPSPGRASRLSELGGQDGRYPGQNATNSHCPYLNFSCFFQDCIFLRLLYAFGWCPETEMFIFVHFILAL